MDEHGALLVAGSRPLFIISSMSTIPITGWRGEPNATAGDMIVVMKDLRKWRGGHSRSPNKFEAEIHQRPVGRRSEFTRNAATPYMPGKFRPNTA
jgi:hypothetical protein